MKQRSRKLSIRMKIILSVIGIMVIVFGFLGGTSIITMRTNLIEMGGEQAQVAAGLALSVVDADELVKLKPGDEDGKLYNSIVEPLREMQKACGVKYMYTLTTDGSKVYYGVDTDETEGRCAIGEEYNHTYEALKSVFEGKRYVADEIENDGFGDLIIAYEPIKNDKGEVVAILASDYDASGITERLSGMTVNIAVFSDIGFVLAFVITFLVAGMLTKGIKQVNVKLYDLVHNEGDLTQKLNVKSGDEMEIMATNLNELLDYIRTIMLKISENSASLHESCTLIA